MLATNNFNGHSGECWLNVSLGDTDGMRLRGIYPTSVNEILWYHDLKKRRKKNPSPPICSATWRCGTYICGRMRHPFIYYTSWSTPEDGWKMAPWSLPCLNLPMSIGTENSRKLQGREKSWVVHCLLRNVPQNKALKLNTEARRNLRIAILKKRKLKDSYLLISKSIIKL